MKKLFALAAVTLASASAFAGLNLTVRGDYLNTPKFDGRNGSEVPGSSIFRGTLIKAGVSAKLGEATVTGLLNLAGKQSGFGTSDATTTYSLYTAEEVVQHLFLTKDFGNGLSASAGKLKTIGGGIEAGLIEVGDNYLNTLANGGVGGAVTQSVGGSGQMPSALGVDGTTTTNKAEYSRGVGLTYKVGSNQIDFQMTNSDNHSSVSSTHKRNTFGLGWSGVFMDKMIEPNVTYITGSGDTTTKGYEDTFIAAGAKFNLGASTLTAEYLSNNTKDSSTGGKSDNVTTVYALYSYKLDAWKPFAKVESSEFKYQEDSSNALSFKRTAYNVGVEMTPKSDENFRYHLSYAGTSDKYGTAGSKETVAWSQIALGIKYSADLLK